MQDLASQGDTDKAVLPPIEAIEPPATVTKSSLIRWYRALGYEVKEIAKYLNIRYQQVRNITTNQPKRAAREDLPALVIVMRETPDLIDSALDGALEASLMADRKDRKATEKAQRRADYKFRDEEDEGE